ncbi:unnamed protein product, partial [marine sediment metagenome]
TVVLQLLSLPQGKAGGLAIALVVVRNGLGQTPTFWRD